METVSLFEMKRVYGWWPCVAQEAGEEMQLTVSVPFYCLLASLLCPFLSALSKR